MVLGKFYDHKVSTRFQGLLHRQDHGFRVRELVIGMCDENQIQQAPGEVGIGFVAEPQLDIAKLMLPYRINSAIKHSLLYIDCQDLAGGSHHPREPPCEIARARSYLPNRSTGGN